MNLTEEKIKQYLYKIRKFERQMQVIEQVNKMAGKR